MSEAERQKLVPYELVAPGFEGIYTGEKSASPIDETELVSTRTTDDDGNVIVSWPVFTWTFPGQEKDWDDEIRQLNEMQVRLGPLTDDTRQIRAHIASLVPCDSGIPVTIDELLVAIGQGKLNEPSFRNGCWCPGMWWQQRTTQPRQMESMRIVHAVLNGYLAGTSSAELVAEFPAAAGFIRRVYDWLGPQTKLTEVQGLMLDRILPIVEYFTQASSTVPWEITDKAYLQQGEAAFKDLLGEEGRGAQLDGKIAEKAGLPKILPYWDEKFRETVDGIEDPAQQDFYRVCVDMASGVYMLSDCHHNTFRCIEGWIYGIGTGQRKIPTRKAGSERERLGRLLFGYVLGLDKWLLDVPMQLLLMDLGHVDLGFDPRNEVVRTYAYLGDEKTPVKQWLAACLWHNLTYARLDAANPAGMVRHQELLDRAATLGVSVREWMDAAVANPGFAPQDRINSS